MSFDDIQTYLIKKTQILQTEAWKQQTTKTLCQKEILDQYSLFLEKDGAKSNFVLAMSQ